MEINNLPYKSDGKDSSERLTTQLEERFTVIDLFQTNKGSSQIRAAIPYLTDQIRAKVSLTLICSGLPLFD